MADRVPSPVDVAARRFPDRWALIRSDGGGLTWRELAEEAARVSADLASAGVEGGHTVAFSLPIGEQAVVLIHALWRVGAVPSPLNPALPDLERTQALEHLTPEWWVSDSGARRLRTPGTPANASRAAAILLTSGSTGAPRGVGLSHGNLEAVNRAAAERLGLSERDVWSLYLSPAHVGGLAMIHRAALTGAALHLPGRFVPEGVLRDAREGRCTHTSLVPTMLVRLVEWLEERVQERVEERGEDRVQGQVGAPTGGLAGAAPGGGGAGDAMAGPAHLACLLVGGAQTPPDLLRRALKLELPVALTYGLTQASSQVATAPPALVREDPGTVGAPLSGVQVRISPLDGEIQVCGPTVAAGMGERFRPPLTQDGWLSTGDRGELNDRGGLRVTGRLGRRIISGGVNVAPEAVEAFLRSVPGVRDAAVVGLPDPEWGERPGALVAPVAGSSIQVEDVATACREGLQPAARPRIIQVAEAIPLNPNGKVDLPAVLRILEAVEDWPAG